MPRTRLQRHIPHKPDDLLALVSNIEDYPNFINLVSNVRRVGKPEIKGSKESFDAEMIVKYKFISENVRCRVDIDHDAKTIRAQKSGKGGPVKVLDNQWAFHELSNGQTLVDFFVDVSLKAFPLNSLLAAKFDDAAEHIMKLFMKKAAQSCPKVKSDQIDLAAERKRLGLS